MIATNFSALWPGFSAALANHLWQSTLFTAAAAFLTLTLRRNQARARYWIWLAASMKFLVPFGPLIAIGKQMSWLRAGNSMQAGLSVTIQEIGQPFTRSVAAAISAPATPTHASASVMFPAAVVLVWVAGFFAVIAIWCMRWSRILAAVRQSRPLLDGPEFEALRRLESALGAPTPLRILSSPTTLEPGIFGSIHPVLLWPEGISRHLTRSHLQAVLTHELCHVRRHDNLAATLHMIVEALFWFHPLVWWIGTRLIDERERACDEQVLEIGGQREVYAESILKVCEFCVGSPLACVAGVTGSELKKRMVHIMSEQIGRKLDFSRKLFLGIAAFLTIAIPVGFGVMQATPSRAQTTDAATTATFQSFSIRPSDTSSPRPNSMPGASHMARMMYGPDSFVADGVTLRALIQEAYGVQANQISGPSDMLGSPTYDVAAKIDPTSGVRFFGPGAVGNKGQLALQAALAEHTKLVLHHETKVLPVYALVVTADGSKLQPSASNGPILKMQLPDMAAGNREVVDEGQKVPVDELARQLSQYLRVTVVDKTGLKGDYDFNLKWTESNQSSDSTGGSTTTDDSAVSNSSLFKVLQQQLGLKLEAQKQPMDILVIDHIEEPTGN